MSAAVVLASSRSHGNTRALVELCWPSGGVALEDLGHLTIGCYDYGQRHAHDDFVPLIERLLTHDPWFLATPLYWYTMSAQAKTFLDRFTDLVTVRKDLGRQLRDKRFGVLCSGSDPALPGGFAEAFERTSGYLGLRFVGVHYAQYLGRLPAQADAAEAASGFARSACA